jgi:hypothetical protein
VSYGCIPVLVNQYGMLFSLAFIKSENKWRAKVAASEWAWTFFSFGHGLSCFKFADLEGRCCFSAVRIGSQGGAFSPSVADLGVHYCFVRRSSLVVVNPNVSQRAQQKEMSPIIPSQMIAGRVKIDVRQPKWDDFWPRPGQPTLETTSLTRRPLTIKPSKGHSS